MYASSTLSELSGLTIETLLSEIDALANYKNTVIAYDGWIRDSVTLYTMFDETLTPTQVPTKITDAMWKLLKTSSLAEINA